VLLKGASGLDHVSLGDSSTLQVGDGVVAIGNALGLGGTPTVTSGIVSALGRSINATNDISSSSEHLTGLIQTDAPINPGNSGGPLVDAAGQVIGMDTAAENGSGTETASNIGFAIPIDRAISIAQQIQQGKSSSTVLLGVRGVMGVEVESIQAAQQDEGFEGGGVNIPSTTGAYVIEVVSGSPAAAAGLAAGDVIVGFNGSTVATPTALTSDLTGDHPGKSVSVTWVDGSGTRHTATLVLETGPAL
jgi:S1-C subfamily serine protease